MPESDEQLLYAIGWKLDDSDEAPIDTADTEAPSDVLQDVDDDDDEDDDVDEEEEDEDEDEDDDDEDDEDDDIDDPAKSMEEAVSGNEAIISPAIRLAEDVSGDIVSVVESTSGTTISSELEDMIALDFGKIPSDEVDGRIVSSST